MKKLLFLLLFSSTAFAQYNAFSGKFVTTLEGLATLSYTDYESSKTSMGVRLTGEYFLPLKSKSAFGFRLSLSNLQISGEDPLKTPNEYKTSINSAGFGFSYSHSANNLFFQSIYGGISYIWFDPLLASGDPALNNRLNLYDKSSQVYDIGGGLKYFFTPSLGVNSSLSLHFLPHDNIDDINVGNHFDVYATISLGITFIFGATSDNDGDGIIGSKDECPDAAEDFDGFEDHDGCPDYDNDGDGIPDHLDKCPDLAEDFDGFEDHDGCPDNDNDRDGIPDDEDECRDIPEDFDGYLDSDGCPDDDNDNDNIPDSEDECPNSPEDYDGYQDEDGCPDLDNDNDGIPDSQDLCPDQPEDFDGFQDEDGCPDPDNDGDGIPDEFDECPDRRETYNNYQDEDGCPDVAPEVPKLPEVKPEPPKVEPPKVETGRTVTPNQFTLDGVLTFYDDDYDIKSQAYSTLDGIVEILRRDSTSRWRIEGHTDNSAPEDRNLKLSQQRATEILLYFVKKGLRYPRFEAVGLGSRYPVADNNQPSGRAKNRRVVIKKIK
jgi:outer membrane protein OmpA-like peptidoglycan-associated protein